MYRLVHEDAGYARREYLLDNESDVSNLPTDICSGSVAYTASLDHLYQLSNQGVWVEI